MRVLAVHSYYGGRSPSGENVVFDYEVDLLRRKGHEVAVVAESADKLQVTPLSAIPMAVAVTWNERQRRRVERACAEFRPDLVHVHNVFPGLSPAVLQSREVQSRAVVVTLHNYRVFCSAGTLMRDGQFCDDCLTSRSVRSAVQHRCYRRSRLATLPLASSIALHRVLGTWTRRVEALIALSECQRSILVKAGLPAEKLHIKANTCLDPGPTEGERDRSVVLAGRISAEKGIWTVLRAWRARKAEDGELHIVGSGEAEADARAWVSDNGLRGVTFHGRLEPMAVQTMMRRAKCVVVASEWMETFGRVVIEAFACGTPVLAARSGALPELVEDDKNGGLFDAGRWDQLLGWMDRLFREDRLAERLARGARATFEDRYTDERGYSRLMEIYETAIDAKRTGSNEARVIAAGPFGS